MDCVSHVASPLPRHDGELCAICLEELVSDVVKTRCGHRFHNDCTLPGMQKRLLGQRTCAICRGEPLPLVRESCALRYKEDSRLFESPALLACRVGDNRRLEELIARHPILSI